MNIPDIVTCVALMKQYKMLANIREHSFVVAKIAGLLGERLKQTSKMPPDLQLCISGALLHDIAKTPCLETGCDHAKTGAEICHSLGFPEIAAIVAEHVILADFNPVRYQKGVFSAPEIVYYADKRVLHDNIVSLSERFDYLLEKYSHGERQREKLIQNNLDQCKQLEKWLFSFSNLSSEALAPQAHQYELILPSV